MNNMLHPSQEVALAKLTGIPVVALESTIITHGMPYPQNLEMARAVEQDIRDNGACPATIAVLGGKIRVGLDDADLQTLAQTPDALKLSRADLADALANGKPGATTVAATMICAHLAGIKVFATGGIGGVHRGAELSFDISADLLELASTPVTVVSAGAKAILDIAKTLEVLETHGVPVITFGQDDFPAFWSRSSGLKSPLRMDSPQEIARAHKLRQNLKIRGGQLIANPIPIADEIPGATLTPIIQHAVIDAINAGITGKAVTPFLLNRIFELTNGASLTANVALVRNNARLAAQIAVALVSPRS